LIDHVNGDGGSWAVSSPATPAAVAGYPHISVPMGSFRGLPMGISFVLIVVTNSAAIPRLLEC